MADSFHSGGNHSSFCDPEPMAVEESNSCCAKLKERYLKLEEKRKALRKGIDILDKEFHKLQVEKENAEKALEEERERLQAEIETKAKESAIRIGLENEISNLRSEISSLQENGSSKSQGEDGEVILLRRRVSECEAETNRLNEILEKERKRGESDRIVAKEQVEQARMQAEFEAQTKESAVRVALENEIVNLKTEIATLQERCKSRGEGEDGDINCLRARISEGEVEINRLNEILEKERKRGDSDRKMAEELQEERARMLVEIEAKAKESAVRFDLENVILNLKSKISTLQESRMSRGEREDGEVKLLQARVTESEAEINRLNELLKKERKRRDSERKNAKAEKRKSKVACELENSLKSEVEKLKALADTERSRADGYIHSLEALKIEVNQTSKKLALEISKNEEAQRKLEAEKRNVIKEKRRADSIMAKVEEQKKSAEEERNQAMKEKYRSDCLSKQLEELAHQNADLKKEVQKIKSARQFEKVHPVHPKEVGKSLEAEKQRADWEKKRADHEMIKAEEQRKWAERERKNAMEEKHRSDRLSEQLQEAKRMIEVLKLHSTKAHQRHETGKQKAYSEKESAKLEMSNVKQQKKCPQGERRIDEKDHSNCLTVQLGVETQRNEELQKGSEEAMSAGKVGNNPVHSDCCINASRSNVMLLKKQLKLEKMYVKHAKSMAKLEKMRNDLLQQEVCCLKQDFLHFSHRLNLLDSHFPHSIEGTDALAKVRSSSRLQESNLKNKLSFMEQSELLKAHFTTMEDLEQFRSRVALSAPLSGERCMEPISGISSELDSVIGGSGRSKSQNSAIYSTTASFSDRPLVGSQGRDALSFTTSAKFTEENPKYGRTVPNFFADITKMKYNENLGVVAENNVKSSIRRDQQSANLNSSRCDCIGAVGCQPGLTKKKKRSRDAEKTIQCMYGDKKLLKEINEKITALYHMSVIKNNMPAERKSVAFGDGKPLDSAFLDPLFEKSCRSKKKRKLLQNQDLEISEHGQASYLDTEPTECAKVCTQVVSTANDIIKGVQLCNYKTVDAVKSNQDAEAYFENMDFMKLLELDNAADEERYRMAIARPLSPTLPKVKLTCFESSGIGNSSYLVEDNMHRRLESHIDSSQHACSLNVIDAGMDSDRLVTRNSDASHYPLPDLIVLPHKSSEEVQHNEDCSDVALDTVSIGAHKVVQPSADMGAAKQNSIPEVVDMTAPSGGDDGSMHRVSKFCVVSSNTKDNKSISRIINATEVYLSQISMMSQVDWVVHKVLIALELEGDLQPEEKACVFFSLLLYNFSVVTPAKFKSFLAGETSLCSDSFSAHVQTVMSSMETTHIFLKFCHSDILLNLIQDFLVKRRVLLYNKVSSEPSRSNMDVVNAAAISTFPQAATIDQLAAGSIILASMCVAVDHIGFICEASYDIIRGNISDPCFLLTVLHAFASICGKKYFSLSNYSLVMTVIKSIVSLLESGHGVVGNMRASYPPSTSENLPRFPQCVNCIFSDGAYPMDTVMRLLLKKLHWYTLTALGCQTKESVTSSNCSIPTDVERDGRSPENVKSLCELDMDFDVLLHECGSFTTLELSSGVNGTMYPFSDILALVQFVVLFMGWKWACTEVIPQLFKMLESCVSEKVSAAIMLLLGQIGRLGIDDNGYEQNGVEELRSRISSLLDQHSDGKWGLPTQYAAVHSLTGLLSIDFTEVVQRNEELLSDEFGNHTRHSNLLRTWFSQLNEQQTSSVRSLFRPITAHDI